MYRRAQKHGFTLIELLVVITIIGVLATIAVVAFSNIQMSARNSRRLADMQQIMKALKLYREYYGFFPVRENDVDCGGWDTTMTDANGDGNYMVDALVTSGIMGKVPRDPKAPSSGTCPYNNPTVYNYIYIRYPIGQWGCDPARGRYYVLGTNMEGMTGAHPASPGWNCPSVNFQNGMRWVTGAYEN